MIAAIAAHLCIGLGGLACGTCGRRFCRGRVLVLVTGIFLLAEAVASVLIIDRMGLA